MGVSAGVLATTSIDPTFIAGESPRDRFNRLVAEGKVVGATFDGTDPVSRWARGEISQEELSRLAMEEHAQKGTLSTSASDPDSIVLTNLNSNNGWRLGALAAFRASIQNRGMDPLDPRIQSFIAALPADDVNFQYTLSPDVKRELYAQDAAFTPPPPQRADSIQTNLPVETLAPVKPVIQVPPKTQAPDNALPSQPAPTSIDPTPSAAHQADTRGRWVKIGIGIAAVWALLG